MFLFFFLSLKLWHYNLEALQLVTPRQISPKRIWQSSTLWSDCIRLSTAKERNIWQRRLHLSTSKCQFRYVASEKHPPLSPVAWNLPPLIVSSRWCAELSSALFLESSSWHQSVMPFSCYTNVAYLSMPINQWHRTGSSLEANVVLFIYFFLIFKKKF